MKRRSKCFKDNDKFIKILDEYPNHAPHNQSRVDWIGKDGKTFSQLWKQDSFYRRNILRKSYAGNGSMIDQDIKDDIKRGRIKKL
tara:strand:+ start:1159 stop:1413 length:255 start_codon:yes stop_codon:yes gene_type:complete